MIEFLAHVVQIIPCVVLRSLQAGCILLRWMLKNLVRPYIGGVLNIARRYILSNCRKTLMTVFTTDKHIKQPHNLQAEKTHLPL